MRYSPKLCALLFIGFFITTANAQKQATRVGPDLNQTYSQSKQKKIRCYTMEMDAQRRNLNPENHSLVEEEK